jgi:hypothetical protein
MVRVITNGIKFADKKFLKDSVENGLHGVCVGLNHKNYIKNDNIRPKQLQCIQNAAELDCLHYVGYTMESLNELDDIMTEIQESDWPTMQYRIRAGSEIGRNSTEDKVFLSDIYKQAKKWATQRNLDFEIIPADNNIYHIMVNMNGKILRLIQWCDIDNIDMEELKSGPWCDFVPQDGLTNFLHQIIRRDIWKNQKQFLVDSCPTRYIYKKDAQYTEFNSIEDVYSVLQKNVQHLISTHSA